MGCFSVTCSASNLAIYEQPAKIQLLIKQPYAGELPFHNDRRTVVSNDGAFAYFIPMFLPVSGVCDSYGGLEDIEKDYNFDAIENYFDMKWEDIDECIHRSKDVNGHEIYGCYIRADVYDYMSKTTPDDFGFMKDGVDDIISDIHKFKKYYNSGFDTDDLDAFRFIMMNSTQSILSRTFRWRLPEFYYGDALAKLSDDDIVDMGQRYYDLLTVSRNMFMVNRMWSPAPSGPQHTDLELMVDYHKKLLSILEAEKSEYDQS